jgi:hypothetical protein
MPPELLSFRLVVGESHKFHPGAETFSDHNFLLFVGFGGVQRSLYDLDRESIGCGGPTIVPLSMLLLDRSSRLAPAEKFIL